MATYLIHAQWTEQGIRNVKESAKRLDIGRKKLKEMGGEIKAFYLTTGKYDSLAIVDVPDDETFAAYLLWLGSQGNLRTHTVRAFTEDEYREILGGIK
jgi:uncharacterized protein with GYD domain